ncbi:MAG: phosphotransferase, partial [Thermoplasmata archaeon]|nr:phosphotransferase [Thermoplasmata archaeon]
MANDFTAIDSFGWDALKKALNQRVVVNRYRLIPSRRNRVWVVETDVRPVVVKQSLSGKCGSEFETLLLARQAGISVPYPLFKEGDFLVMEYIPGETCEVM